MLLDPGRAARLERAGVPGFDAVVEGLLDATWRGTPRGGAIGAIQRQTNMQVLYGLLGMAHDVTADVDVRARALAAVQDLDRWLERRAPRDAATRAHYRFAQHEIARLLDDPAALETLVPASVPPGSPIGSTKEQAL